MSIVDTVREPLIVLDGKMRVISVGRSFYEYFHVTPKATIGHSIYELGNRQWDIPALRNLLENILPQNHDFEGYVMDHEFPSIGRRRLLLNTHRIAGTTGNAPLILLAMQETSS